MIKADYIRDAASIPKFRDEIINASVISVDTETTGLDPHDAEIRLLQIATGPERVVKFDLRYINPGELQFITDKFADRATVKVFQNGKFDMKFLMKHFGAEAFPTVFDTYLASVLIACGDEDIRHGLGALAENFAGIELDKTDQKSDWSGELTERQLQYAARDACLLFPIMNRQRDYLRILNLERVALLEFDCIEAVADMELRGFYLNREHWEARIEKQQVQIRDLAGTLLKYFEKVCPVSLFGEIELDLESPAQVAAALKKLGVPIEDSTQENEIKHLAKDYPVIQALFDYREVSTALKMFGPEYLKFVHPKTGRIHADFRQIGTPTGRFTCSNPNLQQVPAENIYRHSFQAPTGKKLCVADYSMIELRILGLFSRDPHLLEAFRNRHDLHSYTGAKTFGVTLEAAGKGTPYRQTGKQLNFATAYGAGAARFARSSGLSYQKAEEALKLYWKLYNVLDGYLQEAGRRAVEEGESHSFSGRTWRFDFDPTDHKSIAAVERLGRNMPIQGTCSDIMKRAMYLIRNETRGKAAGLVDVVHDETVTEFPDEASAEGMETVNACMTRAAEEVLGGVVPAVIDAHLTPCWDK